MMKGIDRCDVDVDTAKVIACGSGVVPWCASYLVCGLTALKGVVAG